MRYNKGPRHQDASAAGPWPRGVQPQCTLQHAARQCESPSCRMPKVRYLALAILRDNTMFSIPPAEFEPAKPAVCCRRQRHPATHVCVVLLTVDVPENLSAKRTVQASPVRGRGQTSAGGCCERM